MRFRVAFCTTRVTSPKAIGETSELYSLRTKFLRRSSLRFGAVTYSNEKTPARFDSTEIRLFKTWKFTLLHLKTKNLRHGDTNLTNAPEKQQRIQRGIKDVRANCFCASLLRTKFTCHVMHRERALSSKVNNNRANGYSYNFAWI